MDKPEWCPKDIWSDALQVASPLPIGELGQKTLAREVAKAILSAQERAYIDAARIAEEWEPVEKLLPFADDSHNESAHTGQYEAGERISAAILQRKEEIGR